MGIAEQVGLDVEAFGNQPLEALTVFEAFRRAGHVLPGLDAEQAGRMLSVWQHHARLMLNLQLDRFEGEMVLFIATESQDASPSPETWKHYVSGPIQMYDIACRHGDMTLPEPLGIIGRLLEQHLQSLT